MSHTVLITSDNTKLSELKLSWATSEFSADDGIGALGSLHEAGDALVAVACLSDDGPMIVGSGVMVAPGLLITATHVLDEIQQLEQTPLFMTFLPSGARAWLPIDMASLSRPSNFDDRRKVTSDISLVSCTLNSDALTEAPLMLAPMQIALPLIGERLWAIGFRHQLIKDSAAFVTPMISSGLVTAAYPDGRGELLPSPCFEVNMDTIGGMSGGAVINADGYLIGIVSSSLSGGPSYVTLIWEALRLRVRGAIPAFQENETVSLLGANAKGLAKLNGQVDRNPWGELTFTLSNDEGDLLSRSIRQAPRAAGLSDDEKEEFLETWGSELEALGSDATITTLKGLPIPKIKSLLRGSKIPENCLSGILAFSVEDFEGVEDLELISTELLENDQLRIEYFFLIQTLIWTLEVSIDSYQQHKDEFQKFFFNIEELGGTAKMQLVQRSFFRAEVEFDRKMNEFSDVLITSSAIRR